MDMKKALIILLFLCCAAALQSGARERVSAADARITYVGRCASSADGSVSFDWSGVTVRIRFNGTGLSLDYADTKCDYFNVWIDREPSEKEDFVVRAAGEGTLVLAQKLRKGEHSVVLQKRSEGEQGRMTVRSLETDGSLLAASGLKARKIEFIGDSYTCGYGAEAAGRNEPFRTEEENCNLTYAAIAGRYFDADIQLVAHSGRGIIRNYGDGRSALMPDRYPRTFDEDPDGGRWDASRFVPDIVVIYLGTNDFSTGKQPNLNAWCANYRKLLRQIRDNYGDSVPVLCVASKADELMGSYVEQAVLRSGIPNVHWTSIQESAHNNASDLGADYHPNYAGHRKVASLVIPYIATLTGWEMPLEPYR